MVGLVMAEQTRDFFKLEPGFIVISSQEGFVNLLESRKKGKISNILYSPAVLTGRGANFFGRIEGIDFENVSFTKTTIENINFKDCTFRKCLFVYTIINGCEFHKCRFIDTNIHKINFTKSYIDPISFDECLNKSFHQNIGVHLYQKLMNNSSNERQPVFFRAAVFNFNLWKARESLWFACRNIREQRVQSVSEFFSFVLRRLWGWFGAGVYIFRFLMCLLIIIFGLSAFNFLFSSSMGFSRIHDYWDSVYFTTIMLTTVGFGDITPGTTLGKLLVAAQGALGFFLFAMAASIIFRRVSP